MKSRTVKHVGIQPMILYSSHSHIKRTKERIAIMHDASYLKPSPRSRISQDLTRVAAGLLAVPAALIHEERTERYSLSKTSLETRAAQQAAFL